MSLQTGSPGALATKKKKSAVSSRGRQIGKPLTYAEEDEDDDEDAADAEDKEQLFNPQIPSVQSRESRARGRKRSVSASPFFS